MIQDNTKPKVIQKQRQWALQLGKLSTFLFSDVNDLMDKLDTGVDLYDEKHSTPRAMIKMINGRYITTYY